MSFGKMNAFIDIIKTQMVKDAEGFSMETDVVVSSIRAYREGRHGTEKWANRAVFSDATDLFRFRAIPDISVTTDMVIVCEGKRFEITSVEDVKGRGMYVEVLGKKVEASG